MVLTPKTPPTPLRVLRTSRGVTQYDVVKAARISEGRYWKLEHGRIAPTEAERKALARVFGVPASDIFPGQEAAS